MNLNYLLYLQEKNLLTKEKNKLLDIGSQNIYHASYDHMVQFLKNQKIIINEQITNEIERICHFSIPRPNVRTSFLSELMDLTEIEYHSFDVCPALKTEILDLNFDCLPYRHTQYFDVVLNFGTTEHVVNQWNSFKIIHEATKVDGIIYHQLPAIGYLDHGYFCYTPFFFKELANANNYEVLDLFFTYYDKNEFDNLGLEFRDQEQLLINNSAHKKGEGVPCCNINVILKKTNSESFRCSLEIATSHAVLNDKVAENYQFQKNDTSMTTQLSTLALLQQMQSSVSNCNELQQKLIFAQAEYADIAQELLTVSKDKSDLIKTLQELKASRSWKVTGPLRWISKYLN